MIDIFDFFNNKQYPVQQRPNDHDFVVMKGSGQVKMLLRLWGLRRSRVSGQSCHGHAAGCVTQTSAIIQRRLLEFDVHKLPRKAIKGRDEVLLTRIFCNYWRVYLGFERILLGLIL